MTIVIFCMHHLRKNIKCHIVTACHYAHQCTNELEINEKLSANSICMRMNEYIHSKEKRRSISSLLPQKYSVSRRFFDFLLFIIIDHR